jgi:hypothetical protein
VSAHFGKQHMNLVIPIIDFISLYITGGLTNARKRHLDLHLMNTEDHLFPHNGLRLVESQDFLNPGCWPGIQHPKSTD